MNLFGATGIVGRRTLPALPARAQPYDVPPTWGGDFWSRPRLTGSWFGLRDDLGKKGVVFDVDLLLTPQSVMTGGTDTGSEFWGNADYTLNVDTGKLGLWPGGFLCAFLGAPRADRPARPRRLLASARAMRDNRGPAMTDDRRSAG